MNAAVEDSEPVFCAVDFESAGTMPGATDEPVQVGWAQMRGVEIDRTTFFSSYLRTDRKITWAAQRVHGITTDHLAGAPALSELWPEACAAMRGRIMVAHGAGTERRFLRAFPLHGFGPWLDSLRLARTIFPGLGDYSLGALVDRLQLVPEVEEWCAGLRWHHALYDSVASLAVVRCAVRATREGGESCGDWLNRMGVTGRRFAVRSTEVRAK